jgi:hypothetical protein
VSLALVELASLVPAHLARATSWAWGFVSLSVEPDVIAAGTAGAFGRGE